MEEFEKQHSQDQHEDGRAGKELKERIASAQFEIRIAIFCFVILILSLLFRIVDPNLGAFVFDIMWPTAILSIVVACYKSIFGYDPLTLIAIAVAYIALLGSSFGERYVVFCALTALFMLFILKIFVFFFVPDFDRDKNPAVYISVGVLLPVLMFTLLFLNKGKVNTWLSQRFEYFEENGVSGNVTEVPEREPVFVPSTSSESSSGTGANGQAKEDKFIPPHMRKK